MLTHVPRYAREASVWLYVAGLSFFESFSVISPEEKLLEVQFDGRNNFLACFLRPTVVGSRIMLSQSGPNY